MDVFLVNQDAPAAESLIQKLSSSMTDGAVIPLSTAELDLYCSEEFMHVSYGDDGSTLQAIELNPESKYIFVVDEDSSEYTIGDIIRTKNDLGLDCGIIRRKHI